VSVRFLDLSRAVAASRTELEGAVARVLNESRFVLGPQVEAFEEAFASWCGARHAVGVASGTDALALALRAAGVVPGDEVVTAANTCVPTVAAIEAAGARPVLADVDARTRTLDPERLADALTERTRAIVPVHLYGRCADMRRIRALAAERGLAVVEDAAQAHGAVLDGGRAGTLGDAAAFSFYPTKNLGALGDGGAVVTNDPDLAERVRMLRSYGERDRYDSIVSGSNSRLDTLQAAVLLARLPGLEAANERRHSIAARYTETLAGLPLELPEEPAGGVHAFHLYVVAVPDRERFRDRLAERGVETLVHYPRAVHEHPAYRHLARPGELDVSERLARTVVSLPLYPELTDDEVDAVIDAVAAAGELLSRR
jgi:dTDP-3-amino-3,4,6-trideoxy-alpha-D-glucose transaminase